MLHLLREVLRLLVQVLLLRVLLGLRGFRVASHLLQLAVHGFLALGQLLRLLSLIALAVLAQLLQLLRGLLTGLFGLLQLTVLHLLGCLLGGLGGLFRLLGRLRLLALLLRGLLRHLLGVPGDRLLFLRQLTRRVRLAVGLVLRIRLGDRLLNLVAQVALLLGQVLGLVNLRPVRHVRRVLRLIPLRAIRGLCRRLLGHLFQGFQGVLLLLLTRLPVALGQRLFGLVHRLAGLLHRPGLMARGCLRGLFV